jgi:phospholipid-binding lipoprotein MlaA
VLDEAALDKYSFTRDAHLQRRRAEIFDRESDRTNMSGQEPKSEGEPATAPAGAASSPRDAGERPATSPAR